MSESPPRPRPSRRPHRKSRNGCLDCRKRRVKCSEEHPIRRMCERRNVSCIYPERIPSPSGPSTSTPGLLASSASLLGVPRSPSMTSVSPSTPAITPLQNFDHTTTEALKLSDLRLLHHWTVSTSIDLCRCPETRFIWQEVLPQIGFEYEFILHALLGLAALHIAHQSPSERKVMMVDGIYHYSKALGGFQKEISNVTEGNSEALFTWSICNVLYVFAMSNPLQEAADGDSHLSTSARKEKILGAEWIPMIRGMNAVLVPTHNYLRFGRMNIIMSLGNWDKLDPDQVNPDFEDTYFCGTRETWSNSDHAEVYEEALQILRKCRLYSQQFRSMDSKTRDQWGYNKEWSGPLIFIHFAPNSYFLLLQQRQPPALILFSLFGALLHGLNDYWFLKGWGKAIVEVVEDVLGSYWKPWLSWPLQVVQK